MHGCGRFASDYLGADFAGMPLEGSFHAYNIIEGALEDIARKGVPSYAIGLTDTLRVRMLRMSL